MTIRRSRPVTNSTKVRVQTELLLAGVKKRRSDMVKGHEAAVKKYEKDLAVFHAGVVKLLKVTTDAAVSKETYPKFSSDYNGPFLSIPAKGLVKPEKPSLKTDFIDLHIKTLEMAAEPTMLVSADDAARYLGS